MIADPIDFGKKTPVSVDNLVNLTDLRTLSGDHNTDTFRINAKGEVRAITPIGSEDVLVKTNCTGIYGIDENDIKGCMGKTSIDDDGNLIIYFDDNADGVIKVIVEGYSSKNGSHVFKYLGGEAVDGMVSCGDLVENNYVLNWRHPFEPVVVQEYGEDVTKIQNSTISTTNFNDIINYSELKITKGEDPLDKDYGRYWAEDLDGNRVYQLNINTNKGNDFVIGSEIADVVNTGEGNDHVIATKGGDTYTLGTGHNMLHYNRHVAGAEDTVNLTNGEKLDVIVDRMGISPMNVMHHLEVRGNDVVVTNQPNGDSLRIKVSFSGTLYHDGYFANDTDDTRASFSGPYTFEYVNVGSVGEPEYKWRSVEFIDYFVEGEDSRQPIHRHIELSEAEILAGKLTSLNGGSEFSMGLYSVIGAEGHHGMPVTQLIGLFESYKRDLCYSSDSLSTVTDRLFADFLAENNKVTIKDYAKGDDNIADVRVNGVDLEHALFNNVSLDDKTFKGTRLDEVFNAQGLEGATINTGDGTNFVIGSSKGDVVIGGSGDDHVIATEGGDTYTLGTGHNTIRYDRTLAGAEDTVTLTKDENLSLEFERLGHHYSNVSRHLEVRGNDVAVVDNPYRAKLQLVVTVPKLDAVICPEPVWATIEEPGYATFGSTEHPTTYTFELVPYEYSEENYSTYSDGALLWRCTESYGTINDGVKKYLWLTDEEVKNNKFFDENVDMNLFSVDTMHRFGRTELADVLAEYQAGTITSNEELFNHFAQANEVVIKNYAKSAPEGETTVEVNGVDIEHAFFNNVSLDEKTFKGTRLNEIFDASEAEQGAKINTGEGINIVYGSDFNDTVVGGSDHDVVFASKGNDTYTLRAGEPNKIFYNPTENSGNDTINLSKGEVIDIVGFFADDEIFEYTEDGDPVYDAEGYPKEGKPMENRAHQVIDPENIRCQVVGKDVILYNDRGASLTLKNFRDNAIDATVFINGRELDTLGMDALNVNNKGVLTGTHADDYINVTGYTNLKGKGVTINSKDGNDTIVGSAYGDKINAGTGYNTIMEMLGNNKITTGNDGSEIMLSGASSNTVKAGNGSNIIELETIGTNKITTGSGDDTFEIGAGVNTINSGNGTGYFGIYGGVNTITTGKGIEHPLLSPPYDNTFEINGGNNTITSKKSVNEVIIGDGIFGGSSNKITTGNANDRFVIDGFSENIINSGKGNDYFAIYNSNGSSTSFNTIKSNGVADFDIYGGMNNITTGAGADNFNIYNVDMSIPVAALNLPISTIKSGAGDDVFTVDFVSTDSEIDTPLPATERKDKELYLDGGKGDDTYDLSLANLNKNRVIITDAKGTDVVKLCDQNFKAFFDVTIKTDKNGEAIRDKEGSVVVKAIGNDLTLLRHDQEDLDNGLVIDNGLSKKGVCSIENFTLNNVEGYKIDSATVAVITESVAGWLAENGFASSMDVLKTAPDKLSDLIAAYTTNIAEEHVNIFSGTN
ncbi:MAG: calcium-binding protein [bacterium]|nr:calcium-binding protein [bacterium]